MPATVLDTRDRVMNKIDKIPALVQEIWGVAVWGIDNKR